MSEDDDFVGTPAELTLRLKLEREGHAREIENLRTEFEGRLTSLKKQIESGEAPRPDVIHPDDFREMLRRGLPGVDEVTKGVRDETMRVSPDAPKGIWLKPKLKITESEFKRRKPFDEQIALDRMLLTGQAELVEG